MKFSLAISAGGKSSRMGSDKAFLKLGNKTMLERILEATSDLGQAETIIISNQPEKFAAFDLKVYPDVLLEKGSLGGIYTALYHSTQDYCLVLACDMPFLSAPLLKHILSFSDYDIVAPRVENRPQGLHALYRKTCLEPIKKHLDADELRVTSIYEGMKVCYLDDFQEFDPRGMALMNLNSPDDLAKAREMLRDSEK